MIKVLGIGLGIALSFGVASAQSTKKAPARKKPAAAAKKPAKADPKPAATQPDPVPATTASTTPDPVPAPAKADTLPGGTRPAAAPPVSTTPATKPSPAAAPARPAGPIPKTNEKPGTQLDKRGGSGDYRQVAPADEKAAEAAFREGNDRLSDGLALKAAESYRKALARWDHPAIHYNLALALINLDQPIEVHEHLTKALQYGPEPLEKDKYDHGKEYLKLVEGQLADIEVQCEKVGAKVSVDGKEVFVAPGKFASKVRVGKHTFFADKEGYNARVETPFVGAGETFRINLKVYTTPELTRYSRKWDRAWVPYTVLGGGVAFVAAGAILQALAQNDYDDFNQKVRDCDMPTQACEISKHKEITDVRDSADSKRTMGFVGYGIGAAAIATGAALVYINRNRPYQITPEELEGHQASARGSVAVVPIVSPEVMGATVQGHF
jgi:tetratricopeptide (TPR) repeat protein